MNAGQEVRECFVAFARGKGFLDKRDLKAAFTGLFNYRPSNFELTQACSAAGVEDANSVALKDFASLVTPKLLQRDQDQERREMFQAMDGGCSGFLTLQGLRDVLRDVDVVLPDQAVADAFLEADCDRDGRVTFRDFERLLLCST
jgi:Ca2+-binding EF-hand superfamily protein